MSSYDELHKTSLVTLLFYLLISRFIKSGSPHHKNEIKNCFIILCSSFNPLTYLCFSPQFLSTMLHFCNPGLSVSISSRYKSGICMHIHSWIASSSSLLQYLQPHKYCFGSQNELLHSCCSNPWFAGLTGAVIVIIIIIFVFI